MGELFALDRDTYLREHALAVEVARDQTKFIDQAVLSLSGGALGISLTFIDKFIGPDGAKFPTLLALGWAALILSVLAVLGGMHLSQRAVDRHIADLAKHAVAVPGTKFPTNSWGKCTAATNASASLLFLVGIVCLSVFA
jgi:hypothetical protein